jgi:hypothetical protein
MELEEQSEEFKEFFLLAFTRELIENYFQEGIVRLKIEEEVEKERVSERAKEIIKEFEHPLKLSPVRQLQAVTEAEFKPSVPTLVLRPRRRLIIPAPSLPARLWYIQPTPTGAELDLGKLNPLIRDETVQSIECNGPEENIIVKTPVERKTGIILSKEEIEEVINTFSQVARIPVDEGIFRIAAGRLILSAIISEVIGSQFIIKKMRFPPPIQPGFLR